MDSEHVESGRSNISSSDSHRWLFLGNKIPKTEIVFFAQVILVYVVVITSLVNISIGSPQEFWIVLLTSCLGYLMPNPSLKTNKNHGEYVHHLAQ